MATRPKVNLEQTITCPSCGWDMRVVDSADGLHAINRRCRRGDCGTYLLSVFRGHELIETVPLGGTDVANYREALEKVDDLTDADRKRLMLTARDRALALR